jgi:hypothetical protein
LERLSWSEINDSRNPFTGGRNMYGDIIQCHNIFCKNKFKDVTTLKIQDSRYYKLVTKENGDVIQAGWKNDCPICHGTHTYNPVKILLNTRGKKTLLEIEEKLKKTNHDIHCWWCSSHIKYTLTEFGCCPKCGTNLEKYPTMKDHPYPDTTDRTIVKEILGTRKQFNIKFDYSLAVDGELNHTTCNSEKETDYSVETQRQITIEKGIWDTNFSTRYIIEQDYKPWYQKEKKKEGEPNRRKIYASWRYGYV